MRKKCELKCGNRIGKEPFKIVLESDTGDSEPIWICDECATLLNVINKKIEEMQTDESF